VPDAVAIIYIVTPRGIIEMDATSFGLNFESVRENIRKLEAVGKTRTIESLPSIEYKDNSEWLINFIGGDDNGLPW